MTRMNMWFDWWQITPCSATRCVRCPGVSRQSSTLGCATRVGSASSGLKARSRSSSRSPARSYDAASRVCVQCAAHRDTNGRLFAPVYACAVTRCASCGARQSSSTSPPRSHAGRSGAACAARAGLTTGGFSFVARVTGSGSSTASQMWRSSRRARCLRRVRRPVRLMFRRSPSGRGLRSCMGCRRSGWMAGIRGEAPAGCRA
jgi:hypothetical protein